jgi:hypothetical protein
VELKFHKDYQNATKNRVFLQACQGDADVYVVLYETRLDEGFDCIFSVPWHILFISIIIRSIKSFRQLVASSLISK